MDDIKEVALPDLLLAKSDGMEVASHCFIVGKVAAELIRRYPHLRRILPAGSATVAAIHDVGKICPTFQGKIYAATGYESFHYDAGYDENERWGGHATVSAATIRGIPSIAPEIPAILAGHHGSIHPSFELYSPTASCFGGESWQSARLDLVRELCDEFGDLPKTISKHSTLALAGLVTVADWIGSGISSFSSASISEAVDAAGFVPINVRVGLSFYEIFGLTLRAVQISFIRAVQSSGMFCLEAPPGIGKTEAALYAAYELIERGQANGIYFALPTQITSNQIYTRMNDFIDKICPGMRSELAHSGADLVELDDMDNETPSWFDSRKRKLLAPFAVGTIDQALMGVIRCRHHFLRPFGLAGKVVIFDEVHSYDVYMSTLLSELIRQLKALGATVIILSATLTRSAKCALGMDAEKECYPMITAQTSTGTKEIAAFAQKSKKIGITLEGDDLDAISHAVFCATAGQSVLWIENTVAEAQEIYKLFKKFSSFGVPIGLVHSRYTKSDREAREKYWCEQFGKNNKNRMERGRILVGTQVLEQSLDLDADFLVTRLCPSDFLLQRLGRLWRHEQPRCKKAVCEAIILTGNLDGTRRVYDPYVISRTDEIWSKLDAISIPAEVRSVLEATYADREETDDKLRQEKEQLQAKRHKLNSLALSALTQTGRYLQDKESVCSTRHIEVEQVDVYVNPDGSWKTLDNVQMPKNRDDKIAILRNTVSVPLYLAKPHSGMVHCAYDSGLGFHAL